MVRSAYEVAKGESPSPRQGKGGGLVLRRGRPLRSNEAFACEPFRGKKEKAARVRTSGR